MKNSRKNNKTDKKQTNKQTNQKTTMYGRFTSLFKAGFDDNEQSHCLMFIYRETRQNSSIR